MCNSRLRLVQPWEVFGALAGGGLQTRMRITSGRADYELEGSARRSLP
jgi:hypothetical protein